MDQLLFGRKAAAQMLDISVRTLDELILNGRLKPTRIGRRVNVHIDQLRRFAKGDHPTLGAAI